MGGTNVTKKKKTTAKKAPKTARTRSARAAPQKRARAGAKSASRIPAPTETEGLTETYRPIEIRKTKLSAEELDHFRNLLLDKRTELSGTVNQLRGEVLHKSRQDAAGDLSSMPIHMADIGSDNWEQEFTLGLLANENELLREIDDALLRIENKTYGICLGTNKPIQKTRLRAKPWAKYCIAYAREIELRKGT